MFQVTISNLPTSYLNTLTLNYTILILYLLCMVVKLDLLPYMKHMGQQCLEYLTLKDRNLQETASYEAGNCSST